MKLNTRSAEYKKRVRTPAYYSWASMMQRCCNSKHKQYDDYGGRGITVCSTWKGNFKQFLFDMGERPEGLTLDRIDGNKGYCKKNCKWSTLEEQLANRRPYNKIPKPVSQDVLDLEAIGVTGIF